MLSSRLQRISVRQAPSPAQVVVVMGVVVVTRSPAGVSVVAVATMIVGVGHSPHIAGHSPLISTMNVGFVHSERDMLLQYASSRSSPHFPIVRVVAAVCVVVVCDVARVAVDVVVCSRLHEHLHALSTIFT